MNERQQIVCAIALYADGHSYKQIAKALGVSEVEAVELTTRGAEEQADGTMGYMKNCPASNDHVVVRRDDDGKVVKTVPVLP